jgi:hypothetical protein
MKKQIFIAAAFIVSAVSTMQLTAQTTDEATRRRVEVLKSNKTGGWNLKENVKGRVSSSAAGCDIVFTHEVTSPRDAASGLPTGKRQHKPYRFSVSSSDNAVTENTGAASSSAKSSGGGAGKASFSDLSVMITLKGKSQKLDVTDGEFSLPADCPDGTCAMSVSWSWGATNTSTKRCSVDFLLEIQDGVCHAINTKGTGGTNK